VQKEDRKEKTRERRNGRPWRKEGNTQRRKIKKKTRRQRREKEEKWKKTY
jgi:hypothetical protein